MAFAADNIFSRDVEYQMKHDGKTTRVSSSGFSTPSPSPRVHTENNPNSKWDEYLRSSQQLRHWLQDAIVELSKRDFPPTLREMKAVANNFAKFRAGDVGEKSQERYRLANMFDDLQNTTRQYPLRPGQHINEVNKLWNEFVLALQEKDSAVHIELSRLQRMDNLIDRVDAECSRCKDLLDNLEAKVTAIKKWGHGSKSALSDVKQVQGSIEELFQVLFGDLQKLQEGGSQDLSQVARSIQSLRSRYSNLKDGLLDVVEPVDSEDISSLEDSTGFMTQQMQSCFNWLKMKEKEQETAGYGRDLRTCFEYFELQKTCQNDIKAFQASIQECINAKTHVPPKQQFLYNKQLSQLELLYIQLLSTSSFRLANLRTLVSFLKDITTELDWMKNKESRTSDSVSSADFSSEELEKFYVFGNEFRERNDKFALLLKKGDNLMGDQHPASNTIQFFCNLLRVQHAWLSQLSQCLEVHAKNMKAYKQFHKECNEVDRWSSKQLHLISELSSKRNLDAREAEQMFTALMETKTTMNHYKNVLESLEHQSADIQPIKISSRNFPPNTQLVAICSYKLSNFSIREGEKCILLSDSLSSKWKVRNSAGLEGILPSVCFLVSSENADAVGFISRLKKNFLMLREQTDDLSSMVYNHHASELVQQIKSLTMTQYQGMSLEERSLLRKKLNDNFKYLTNNLTKNNSNYTSFQRDFSSCQQTLDDFEEKISIAYSKPNLSVVLLNELGKLMQDIDKVEHQLTLCSQASFYTFREKVESIKRQLSDADKCIRESRSDLESLKQKYRDMNPSQRTTTIEEMYSKVQEKYGQTIQMYKVLLKRLETTSDFASGKTEAQKFLGDIENSLLKYPCLHSDATQVNEVRRHWNGLQNQFLQNNSLLIDLETKEKLLRDMNSKLHPMTTLSYPDVHNINKDLKDIKSSWEELQKQITERKSNVERAHECLGLYKGEERKVNQILSDYESTFQLNKQDASRNAQKSVETLISLFQNVKSFRFKMESLNKYGGLFLKEAKAYEKSLENLQGRLGGGISSNVQGPRMSTESFSRELKSFNDRYSALMESIMHNLSTKRPELEKMNSSYVIESEREFPSFRTFQSELNTYDSGGAFEVPTAMEEHFTPAETSWSKANMNRLTSAEEQLINSENKGQTSDFYRDNLEAFSSAVDTQPQEEHMHSEDTEEFVQPIKDGKEKITKHTKQEFHCRKTATGFESVSTHEKKLLSFVSTEASAYSGKISLPIEINRAIQYKLVDPESGTFTHPESNEQMSLKEAIDKNILTIDTAVFFCPTSSKTYALKEAFRLKLLDSCGSFSSLNGDSSFDQLIKDNFVKLKSDKQEIVLQNYASQDKSKSVGATSKKVYFAITNVIDPTTKKILDAFSAVQRGILDQANGVYNGRDYSGNVVPIPISQAINLGLVFVDETPFSDGIVKNKLIKETKTFTVKGVIDPKQRKKLSLVEAVDSGFIDQVKGLFHDPIKKTSMPIHEAISLGHVLADVSVSVHNDDDDDSSSKKILTSKEVAYTISSLINPFNGKEISALDAIKLGVFDPNAGMYKNLNTGEQMSLSEAVEKKLIKMVQGKPESKEISREEKVSSLHIDDELDAREEMAHEEIVEERKTFQITGVKDPHSGNYIPFLEAVARRIIDERRGLYCDFVTGQNFTIPEALEKGFIIGTTQFVDQQELFKSAVVAQKKEDIIGVYNPITDSMVSVNEALQLGLLNKDMTLYFDPALNDVLNMDAAIWKGYVKTRDKPQGKTSNRDKHDESVVTRDTKVSIDWSGGKVLNRATKEIIPTSKALELGLIEDYVAAILRMKNPEEKIEEKVVEKQEDNSVSMKMVVQVTYLRDESGRIIIEEEMSTEQQDSEFVDDSWSSSVGLSFYDAVMLGLYDIRKGVYFDPFSKKTLTLKESIEARSINPYQPALKDISTGTTLSLHKLFETGLVNPTSGILSLSQLLNQNITLDPDFLNFLAHKINLEDAIRCGLFDDDSGLFQVPFSKKSFDLESAIKNDYISGEANVVLNPVTGERLLLSKAIESNVISGKSGKFVDSTLEQNVSLSKAIILGLIKHRYQSNCSIIMDCQTGELIPLEHCIDSNFIDQSIPCVYNSSTKSRISISAALANGLINKKRNVFVYHLSHTEEHLSEAAKIGLIQFPGAPFLSNADSLLSDIVQSSLHTDVSLLKGARLQENITDSFGEVPFPATRDFMQHGKVKKLSDNSTEVSFERNEPNKKVFETKTFDTNTDETLGKVEITKEGGFVATRKVVDKVQKSQIKETVESVNSEFDLYPKSPLSYPEVETRASSSQSIGTPIKSPHYYPEVEINAAIPLKRDTTIKLPELQTHREQSSFSAPLKNAPSQHHSDFECKTVSSTKGGVNPITEDFTIESALDTSNKHARDSESTARDDGSKRSQANEKMSASKKDFIKINWNTGTVTDLTQNVVMTSKDALERGFIDIHIKELLDKAYHKSGSSTSKKITINEALSERLLILPLSKIRNPKTKQDLTLAEAIATNFIDVDRSIIIDPQSMEPRSVSELVEQQVFNVENAVMKNLISRKIMTLSEIVQRNLIPELGLPEVDARKIMPIKEAIFRGLLNEHTNEFNEPTSGIAINLETALRIGYLRREPSERLDTKNQSSRPMPVTVAEALKSGIISPQSFLYNDHLSGEKLSLADAISKGLIVVPDLDSIDAEVEGIDFETAFKQGYVDIKNNVFIDPITNVLIPLNAAIKKGYVILPKNGLSLKVTEVKSETCNDNRDAVQFTRYLGFSDLPLDFGDALLCGLYDEVAGTFLDPYGSGPLTLEEALQYNLIKHSSKVKNPMNGEWISLSAAIKEGHLDSISGKFIDPSTFSAISLREAEELGLFYDNGPCLWVGKFQNSDQLSSSTISFKIVQVYDSLRNTWISPHDAIRFGYLSLFNNLYVDMSTNSQLSLFKAMNMNKIKVEILDTRLTSIYEKTFVIDGVIDPTSKKEISPNAADQKLILDIYNKTYSNLCDGSKVSLHEAYLSGLIKAHEVDLVSNKLHIDDIREVMDHTTGEKWTISEAIENKLIDHTMSFYTDPRSGQKFTLYEAWKLGYLFLKSDDQPGFKSKMVKSVIDPRTGEEIPISDAIRHKIVDKAGNKYWNMKTNSYMDLDYAITKGLVLTESAEKAFKKPAIIEVGDQLNSSAKVFVIKSVRDPSSDKEFDPVEAERRGYINKIRGVYMNPLTGKHISIKKAIDQGHVCASLVDEPDYDVLKKNEDAYAVLESAKSLQEISSVVDPMTNEKISLFEGVRRGLLDLKGNSIINKQSGKSVSVSETLNRNLSLSSLSQSSATHDHDDSYLFKVVEPFFFTIPRTALETKLAENFKSGTMTLKKALSRGLIDQDKELFFDPISCQTMSILEGLNTGKLIADCPTVIDNQFQTFTKTSEKVSTVDLGGDITKMFNNRSAKVDIRSKTDDGIFSTGRSYWHDGLNTSAQTKSFHSFVADERSSASREGSESLDQLLAELEHSRNSESKLHNYLQIDDNIIQDKEIASSAFSHVPSNVRFSPLTGVKQNSEIFHFATCKSGFKNGGLIESTSDLLSEELNEELVIREDARDDSSIFDYEKLSSPCRTLSLASASDMSKEQVYTLDELLRLNLYNRTTGTVCNPDTKKEFPLLEAIERGIVQKNSVKLCDPTSGMLITLTDAFERGIMDAENGNLTHVGTGKVISFSDSVNRALDLKHSTAGATNGQSRVSHKTYNLYSALEDGFFDSNSRCFKFPESIPQHTLKAAIDDGFITTYGIIIKDPTSGQKVLLDTLITLGLVDLEKGVFKDSQGCDILVEKAFQEKILFYKDISARPYSLKILLEDGLYYLDSDKCFDPDTRQFVSMKQAIDRKILDPMSVLFADPSSSDILSLNDAIAKNLISSEFKRNSMSLAEALDKGIAFKKPITLSKAVESGLFNETTGKFLDPAYRKFFGLEEAIKIGFISEDSMIADPCTRELLTISQAISLGVVDCQTGGVINNETNEVTSLKEACMSTRLLNTKLNISNGDKVTSKMSGLQNDQTLNKHSQSDPPTTSSKNLGDNGEKSDFVVKENDSCKSHSPKDQYDSEPRVISCNKFVAAPLQNDSDLKEALERQLIDRDSCLLCLPWSGEILSLQNAIEMKLIDLKLGIVRKPNSMDTYLFSDVVWKGSIEPNNNNFSLAEAISLGVFKLKSGIVTDPNSGRQMSVYESLQTNLISFQKSVLIINGEILNLLEAILKGFVDKNSGDVKDPASNNWISFVQAVQYGIVLDAYLPPKYSFKEICESGFYDRTNNYFINPFTKKYITMKECQSIELLDPDKCSIFLPDSKQWTSLLLLANQKLLSDDLNLFADPLSGVQYSVLEALEGSLQLERHSNLENKSNEASNSMTQSEIRGNEILFQKLGIYKEWILEAFQQIGLVQITANKDDLTRELKRLQQFSETVNEIKPDLTSLQNQTEKTLSSQNCTHNMLQFEKLRSLSIEVKSQYNSLQESLKNQVKSLASCQEELMKYQDEKFKFEDWLKVATEDFDSKFLVFKHIKDVSNQKEAIKNYMDEVYIRQGDLKFVDICKNQFLDQARHYDALQMKNKILKRSSSHLDLLYSMVDDIKLLSNEYGALRSRAQAHLDKVEAVSDCLKRIEDLEFQIKNGLMDIMRVVDNLHKREDSGSMKTDISRQIKNCSSELHSQYLFFEKLKTFSNDVTILLKQFSTTECIREEINDKIDALEKQLKSTDEILKAKNQNVESLPLGNQSADVRQLSNLVEGAENLVEELNDKKAMLDEDLMIGRLKEVKVLGQEISALEHPLSHLLESRTQESTDASLKLIQDGYKDVVKKFKAKEKELEDVFAIISRFNSEVKKLKTYMNDVIGRLEANDTTVEELRLIHKNIQVENKEFVDLKMNMEEFLMGFDISGKEKVEELVNETETGLTEVEDLCLIRISQEEKKKEFETDYKRLKDKILLWIIEKENILNSSDNISIKDVQLLNELLDEFHSFRKYLDELNNTCFKITELHTDCDKTSSAYKRLRRALKKGLRSPSPISLHVNEFEFEEATSEHHRTFVELTSRYESIGQRLETESKESIQKSKVLGELEGDCKKFQTWLEKTENSYKCSSSVPSSDDILRLKNWRIEILKKEADINSIKMKLQRFLESPIHSPQILTVSEHIDKLEKRWEGVQRSSADYADTCTEQMEDVALFESLHGQLLSWLSMKEKVLSLCLGSLGVDCDVLENQSIQIALLREELKTEEKKYQLFTDKGCKIVQQCNSEKISKRMNDVHTKWNALYNKLAEKHFTIAQLLERCTSFYNDLSLLDEMSSAATTTSSAPLKISESKLLERIKGTANEMHDLVTDSNSHVKIQNKVAIAEDFFKAIQGNLTDIEVQKRVLQEHGLSSFLLRHDNLSKALKSCSSQLSSIDNNADFCTPTSVDADDITEQIQTQKEICNLLESWKENMDSLKESASQLRPGLNKNEMENMFQQIRSLDKKWSTVDSEAKLNLKVLEELHGISIKYQEKLDSFQNSLVTAEKRLESDIAIIDLKGSSFIANKIQSLSEEVDQLKLTLKDLFLMLPQISNRLSSPDLSTPLSKNLNDLVTRLNKMDVCLSESEERVEERMKALNIFTELHGQVLSLLDEMDLKEETFKSQSQKQHYEDVLTKCESNMETLDALHLKLKAFLSSEAASKVSEAILLENNRYQEVLQKFAGGAESSKNNELGKLQHDADELSKCVSKVKHGLSFFHPIEFDSTNAKEQLAQQKITHQEVVSHKDQLRNIVLAVERGSGVLKVDPDLDEKIENLTAEVNSCFKSSAAQLDDLERGYALVFQFHQAKSEIVRFLEDVDQRFRSLDLPLTSIQEIKRQQGAFMNLRQKILDQRFLLDRFNKMSAKLGKLVGVEKKEEFDALVDDTNGTFNDYRIICQNKLNKLDQSFHESAQISDKVEHLSGMLEYALSQIDNADSVSCLVDRLEEQIDDVALMREEIQSKERDIRSLQDLTCSDPTKHVTRELTEKIKHVCNLYQSVKNKVGEKEKLLEEVLDSSRQFWNLHAELSTEAKLAKDALCYNFDSFKEMPLTNPLSLQQHLQNVQATKEINQSLMQQTPTLLKAGSELADFVDNIDALEIKNALECINEEVNNLHQLQCTFLSEATQEFQEFASLREKFDEISACLEESELKLNQLDVDQAGDQNYLQTLQDAYLEGLAKLQESYGLKDKVKSLVRRRAPGRSSFVTQTSHLQSRWLQLIDTLNKRIAVHLKSSLSSGGGVEHMIADLLDWSRNVGEQVANLPNPTRGCFNQIHSLWNYLELLKMDVHNHWLHVKIVSNALDGQQSVDKRLESRMKALEDTVDSALLKIEAKMNGIKKLLEEAKEFDGNLEDVAQELDRIVVFMKSRISKHYYSPPVVIQEQLMEFQTQAREFLEVEEKVSALLKSFMATEESMTGSEKGRVELKAKVDLLQEKSENVKKNLEFWKKKLEDDSKKLEEFEKNYVEIGGWLSHVDGKLKEFHPVRKTVDRCHFNKTELQNLNKDLNTRRNDLKTLDGLALQLKCTRDKTEPMMVGNMMTRMKQSFRNSRQQLASLQSSHNKALADAMSLKSQCSDIVDCFKSFEQKMLGDIVEGQSSIEAMKYQAKECQEFLDNKRPDLTVIQNSLKTSISQSCPEDQQILAESLSEVTDRWSALCLKAAERQNKLEESLLKSSELGERVHALLLWLNKVQPSLTNLQNLYGNFDFVTELEEEHNIFLEELSSRSPVINSVEEYHKSVNLLGDDDNRRLSDDIDENDFIQAEILELKQKWNAIQSLAAIKTEKIKESLGKAKRFDKEADNTINWMESMEEILQMLPPTSDDENILHQQSEELKMLEENISQKASEVERFFNFANEILAQAHPDVVQDLSLWLNNFKTRWNTLNEQLDMRRSTINSSLEEAQRTEEELEELLSWLLETEKKLRADYELPIVENLPIVEQLFQDFELLDAEIHGKQVMFDRIMKNIRCQGESAPSRRGSRAKDGRRTPEPTFKNDRGGLLYNKWRQVWVLTMDRRGRLLDVIERLNESEQMKNFDPDEWLDGFFNWMDRNPSNVVQMFAKYDRKNSGKIGKSDFVKAILNSDFSTSEAEVASICAVFEEDGLVDYRAFISAMHSPAPECDSEKITNEIEKQSRKCTCQKKYLITKHSAGKYKFGPSESLRLVRIQRNCVTVRVGGGWMYLEEFLQKNDPCRSSKRKLSSDLKERFSLAEGISQSMAPFRSKKIQKLDHSPGNLRGGSPLTTLNISRSANSTSTPDKF